MFQIAHLRDLFVNIQNKANKIMEKKDTEESSEIIMLVTCGTSSFTLKQRHVLFDGYIRHIIGTMHQTTLHAIIPVEIIDLCYFFYQINFAIGDTVKLCNFSWGTIKWIGQFKSHRDKTYVGVACDKQKNGNKNLIWFHQNGYNGITFECSKCYDGIFVPFEYIIDKKVYVSRTIKRIDNGLRRYYGHKNIPYENEEGIGKFMAWVDENGYNTEAIEEELRIGPDEAAIVDFDDDFPTDNIGDETNKQIFGIIAACYRDPDAFINSSYLSISVSDDNRDKIPYSVAQLVDNGGELAMGEISDAESSDENTADTQNSLPCID